MKLSTLVAKLTFGKAKVLTTLGGLAMAGAALTAAAPAAQAQQFAVGVQFGGPRYVERVPVEPRPVYRPYPAYGYAPGYYDNGERAYWEHRRAEEWRAREYWEHQRDFDRRFHDRDGWR